VNTTTTSSGNLFLVRVLFVGLVVLALQGVAVNADEQQASEIIREAIHSYGGKENWAAQGTMVVHESQTRYLEGESPVQVTLIHYMDTNQARYRVDLDWGHSKHTYGWDGDRFWAVVDGKQGNEEMLLEARRVISDAYFRFSLPFILENVTDAEIVYEGTEQINGVDTNVVKITYQTGPSSRYWTNQRDEQTPNPGHADEMEHGSGGNHHQEQSGHGEPEHGSAAGHHHAGNEVYYFYFDGEGKVVQVYFSHHGDDSYETLLFGEHKEIDGVIREHSRKLLSPDGELFYDSKFTRIEFRQDLNEDFYANH